MNENEGLYFITVLTNISKDYDYSSRCVGYVKNKEYAIKIVENNVGDIFETCYYYSVIEKVPEGLYQYAVQEDVIWFKYNIKNRKYKRIEQPKEMENICGFAIG